MRAIALCTIYIGIVSAGSECSPGSGHPVELGPAVEFRVDELPEHQAYALEPEAAPPVDIGNRAEVVAFYRNVYLPGDDANAGWTGAISGCRAGDVAAAYRAAAIDRVNYYRAMAGLPANVEVNAAGNPSAMEAALIMIAKPGLSHSPPQDWPCWTQSGASAAGISNLALGSAGPSAVRNYMYDFGSNNARVGHRRWILYPPQQTMSSGSTTARNGSYTGSNCLMVADTATFGPRPQSPEWVSWPPPGYVPYQVVDPNYVLPVARQEDPRWSFSMYRADFTEAEVSMSRGANPVPLTVVSRIAYNTIPDAGIVWQPEGLPRGVAPAQDTVYSVSITGVVDQFGQPREFSYGVIVIDPDGAVPPTWTPTRTATRTPTPTVENTPTPVLPSDLNGDGRVDSVDLLLLSLCWGSSAGYAGFDSRCDLNGNGEIDAADLQELLTGW